MYLYRYDNEWLMANIPIQGKRKESNKIVLDWNARNLEYVQRIKKLHQQLLTMEKPVQINWKRISDYSKYSEEFG